MKIEIELYKEGDAFMAYISDDMGGSGIEASGSTEDELAENIKEYVSDYIYDMED